MISFFLLAGLSTHFVGDYILQNNWMALEKTTKWAPALLHGLIHALLFSIILALIPGATVLSVVLGALVIGGTHAIIDHYRLVKPVIWALNQLAPARHRYTWAEAKENNGYPPNTPFALSIWLMIIFDNTIHVLINSAVIILSFGLL